jgi:hypothetical protein
MTVNAHAVAARSRRRGYQLGCCPYCESVFGDYEELEDKYGTTGEAVQNFKAIKRFVFETPIDECSVSTHVLRYSGISSNSYVCPRPYHARKSLGDTSTARRYASTAAAEFFHFHKFVTHERPCRQITAIELQGALKVRHSLFMLTAQRIVIADDTACLKTVLVNLDISMRKDTKANFVLLHVQDVRLRVKAFKAKLVFGENLFKQILRFIKQAHVVQRGVQATCKRTYS